MITVSPQCGFLIEFSDSTLLKLPYESPQPQARAFVVNGAQARKECSAACIGCGKCVKVCPFEAITLADNLAYIDFEKCRLCHKCVAECPTKAIHTTRIVKEIKVTE